MCAIKLKKKNYHTVGSITKSNIEIVERGNKKTNYNVFLKTVFIVKYYQKLGTVTHDI
jgi:hypothetical protein